MPADSPIPLAGDALLEWRMKYPRAADDLIRAVNLLTSMEVALVTAGANNTGKSPLLKSAQNYVLTIPIKFAAPIADSTATAASVSAQLNTLLASLRTAGILPTA